MGGSNSVHFRHNWPCRKKFMQKLLDDSHCSRYSLVESIGRQSRRPFEEHFIEKTLILVNLINSNNSNHSRTLFDRFSVIFTYRTKASKWFDSKSWIIFSLISDIVTRNDTRQRVETKGWNKLSGKPINLWNKLSGKPLKL